MKHMLEENGKTNERQFVITAQNGEKDPRNNRYPESFVVTVRSGLMLLLMSKLTRFHCLSQEKYQRDLRSVLIPGKPLPELPRDDMFIVLSIMMKNSTAHGKEIISGVWRDSGVFSNENPRQKEE